MKRSLIIIGLTIVIIIPTLFYLLKLNQSNTIHPPDAIQKVYNIEIPSSTFNFNISYDINNLADYLNKKITGSFLVKELLIQQKKKEKIRVTLTKTDNIVIIAKGQKLVCIFPVIVDAELTDSRFGKLLTGLVKPVHTSIIITLSTPVTIDKQWCIVTHFKIVNHIWAVKPVLQIGPFKINMEERLNKAIKENSLTLTSLLDSEIYKAATLKPSLVPIWHDLQEPILISSIPNNLWIKFICSDISGKIKTHPSRITCMTAMHAKMFIITDTTAASKTNFHSNLLPELKALKEKDVVDKSDIYIYAFTSFREINQQLNSFVKGKTFSAKGHSVTIKKIYAYASTKGLSVIIITDNNDYFILSGNLMYDAATQTLKTKNFDFEFNPKHRLLNAGVDLYHNRIKDSIETKLVVKFNALIQKAPNLIHNAIEKEKSGKVIDLNLNNVQIKKCIIIMDREKIHLIVNIGMDANLKLKKIQTGKIIRITDRVNTNKHHVYMIGR